MNYRHVYMCIVMHAKQEMLEGKRPLTKYQKRKNFPNQYFEFHHILPKSLFPQYKNFKQNLVALTAREHFFCHQLLTKIWPSKQMTYALFVFISRPNSNYHISSKEYEKIKTEFSKMMSEKMKGISRNKGLYSTFPEGKKKEINEKRKATKIKNGTYDISGKNNPMHNKHWKDHPEWKHADRTGKNNSNYGNHKLAGKNNPMYGKNVKDFMTPEAYKDMRKKQGQKTAIRLLKKVLCIEDNKIMNSCSEVCKIYGISMPTLSRIIRKETDCQACPGKHFKFI